MASDSVREYCLNTIFVPVVNNFVIPALSMVVRRHKDIVRTSKKGLKNLIEQFVCLVTDDKCNYYKPLKSISRTYFVTPTFFPFVF